MINCNLKDVAEIDALIAALQVLRKEAAKTPSRDLRAARRIAGEQSRQTGMNYKNFESGRYDHAFGVRTALAAIKYGRENPE